MSDSTLVCRINRMSVFQQGKHLFFQFGNWFIVLRCNGHPSHYIAKIKCLLKSAKRNENLFLTFLCISAHIRNAFVNTNHQKIDPLNFYVRTQYVFAWSIQLSNYPFADNSYFAFIFYIAVINETSLQNIHRLLQNKFGIVAIYVICSGFCSTHYIIAPAKTT